MKHTIEVEVPAGYKPVAFRTPAKGELHIVDGKVVRAIMDFERSSWMIVEKLTPPEFTREQFEHIANCLTSGGDTANCYEREGIRAVAQAKLAVRDVT